MFLIIIAPILFQITYSQKCLCSNLTYAFDCIQAKCQWVQEPNKTCHPTHCANLTQPECTYTKMLTRDNSTLCHWHWEDDATKGSCKNFTKCEHVSFKTEAIAAQNCIQYKVLNKQCGYQSGKNCSTLGAGVANRCLAVDEGEDEDEDYKCSDWHDNREICNIIIEGDRQCFHHEDQCLKIPDILQCRSLPNMFACGLSDECIWNDKLSVPRCERKRCENQNPCQTFVLDNFINFCKEMNNTCIPGLPKDLNQDTCSSLTEYYYRWNPSDKECISCQIMEKKQAVTLAILILLISILVI